MVSLLSVHIPKTAGTSFKSALENTYESRVCYDYGCLTACDGTALSELSEASVVHGHIWPGKYQASDVITWVRDPVERLVSHHEHYMRNPDPGNALAMEVATTGMSLLEFAAHPDMTNFMTKMFGPFDYRRFAFIGICEDYANELDRLADRFGWAYQPRNVVENVNPRKQMGQSYPISQETREFIRALNQADYVFYNYAKEQAKVAVSTPDFAPFPSVHVNLQVA